MKKPLLSVSLISLLTVLLPSITQRLNAQCEPGQVEVMISVTVDDWGQEIYWEMLPSGNNCGDGTIYSAGNLNVGCAGTDPANVEDGYPDNTTNWEGPFCITDGDSLDLIYVDSYGDGGASFEIYENGSFAHFYNGGGDGNIWTFEVGNSGLPLNDSPCGASEIIPDGDAVSFDNTVAAIQSTEPHPTAGGCGTPGFWCEGNIDHTVWAYFIASAELTYEITTCNAGPGFDTQLALYRATNCMDFSTFELISSNDDMAGGCSTANGFSSRMFASCLNEGEIYYIQMDGWAGATGIAEISVSTFVGTVQLNANVGNINCPLNKGDDPNGSVVPYLTNTDVNFSTTWTGPNGFESTENYLYGLMPGEYFATVISSCGDTYEESFTVTQAAQWNVTAAVVGPDCEASANGSIDLNVSGATAPYTYAWVGPNEFSSDSDVITELANGVYGLVITDENGCDYAQNFLLVPQDDFVFDLGDDTTICIYDDAIVYGPAGLSYVWQDGSVNQFFEIEGQEWGLGTHSLILTATTPEGCSYSDGYIFIVDACTSVEEMDVPVMSIYPNPMDERLTVSFKEQQNNVSIQIFDAFGKTVAAWNALSGARFELNPELAHGIYTVVVKANDHIWSERVVR